MLKNNTIKARNLKNIIDLIVCEVCSISVGLIFDCILFFNYFKSSATPIAFICALVVLSAFSVVFRSAYLKACPWTDNFIDWIKERVRKFFVSLKKNPQVVPILALCVSFLQFSLNLSQISNATAKIQGSNMGLSAFVSMLFMILSFVCMLNAYPKRQKPKFAMIALMLVLYIAVIIANSNYANCINYALTREIGPIVITEETMYIKKALATVNTNTILVAITAVCAVLEPVFAKLFKMIKTSIEVEGSGNIGAIDISEED